MLNSCKIPGEKDFVVLCKGAYYKKRRCVESTYLKKGLSKIRNTSIPMYTDSLELFVESAYY